MVLQFVPLAGEKLEIDWLQRSKELEQEAELALAAKHRELLGIFDTGLRCNCKEATIRDYASERKASRSSEVVFGPMHSARERLQLFRVSHQYLCDNCGALFSGDIIEGKRGYVPREQRP